MPAPSLAKLDFQEKLIQSGRKENTEAVLKRIKTLHQKLSVLEQETTDVSSLKSVCKQLVSELILHHKDRGVKAYAACCLADSLRICAPDAPYTADQLRDIFQFFVAQLTSNLKPPPQNARLPPIQRNKSVTDSQIQSQSQSQTQASQRVTEVPYYNEYCYLLESLATIKSASLACDVPDSEEILTGFFDGFSRVVRPDMSKSVIRHLGEILVCLVDEATTVPPGVLDCIIGQFTEFASRPETPSFQLIVDVCNKTAEKLTRPINSHFSAIQLEHGRNPSTDDLKSLSDSHTLLLNIFRFSPGLLLNVVPLLEANLKAADEVPLRQLSTRTLGRMFGERPVVGTGRADLAKAYPSAWRAWLGRKVDKALVVRLAWVDSTRGILCNHPELRRELEAELIDRIHDADERVRAAICKVIGNLDFETALHHISEETLKAVGGRMSDKRSAVRSEAASALGKLWSLAYTLIESNDTDVIAQFAWIPEMMLLSLLKRDVTNELRTQIGHIFKTVILPLPEYKADIDIQAWVDRLLLVSSHLNTPAFGALKRLTGLIGFAKGGSPYRAFVDFCEANNGGVIDQDEEKVKARLEFVISAIAQSQFVDVEKARKDMESFAAINEQRLYRLYKVCVDVHSDLESLVKSRHELRRRLEQHHSDILDTFTTILDAGSWNIINRSAIPPLIAALQKTAKGPQGELITQAAREWLRLIAKEGAVMYKSHVPSLVKYMDNGKEILSESALQGLAAVVKADKDSCPTDSKVIAKAHKIAMEGTPKQAKYAARFLAFTRQADAECSDLVDTLVAKLNVKNKLLVSHLSALAEMALSASDSFARRGEEIMEFVTKKVIAAVSPSAGVEYDLGDDWVDESELESLDQAKLLSLRISTHRTIGFARATDRLKILQPVIELLDRILTQDGRNSAISNEGCHARVHMRYRATTSFLKLAKVKDFDRAITPYFHTIATMMMDPSDTLRHRLLIKLSEILPTQRMLPRWNIVPAMCASDPEPENIALAKSIMQNNIRACSHLSHENRIERIEMPFARLILMVSHLDEEWDLEGMKLRARYLELYLECVATKDNVDLLYHIAGKVKTVRDKSIDVEGDGTDEIEDIEGESADARKNREKMVRNKRIARLNTKLYSLSELAQLIIRNKAQQHNWPISTYVSPFLQVDQTAKRREPNENPKMIPKSVSLPNDIFHNLSDQQAGLDNFRSKFLDDEIADHVKGLGRRGFVAKRVNDRTSPVKRSKQAKKPRKRSKKNVEDSDDDDDDEESDSSGSEIEVEEGEEDVEMEVEEEGESAGVVGRGGRRGAKTKAKKAVNPKKKRNSKSKSVSAEESDLTEEEE